MSGEGGGILGSAGKAFEKISSPISKPATQLTQEILGENAASTGLGGFIGGAATTRSPLGGLLGAKNSLTAEKIAREQRKAAEAAASDQARLDNNTEIIRLAQSLSGQLAQNPFIDFEEFSLTGDDQRSEQFDNLISNITGRADQVKKRTFQPSLSQTRLSLAE